MHSNRATRRAFTLIELLVVIAIIAVLISILLPALSQARVQGQKIKCQSNLRAVGQTALTYAADDPKGIIGPVHPMSRRFNGGGYAEYGGGPGKMPYMGWGVGLDPSSPGFDPRTRPFNHIIYGRHGISGNTVPGDRAVFEIFQCPGDEKGWQEWPGLDWSPNQQLYEVEQPYYRGNGTAFRMNNLAYTDGLLAGIFGRPINRIQDTSLTLAFLESRVYETIFVNEVWGYTVPGELTGYHRKLGFFDVVFADGHAAYHDFGLGTYYPQTPEYQNLDVRGTWGRMDTFPEPRIDPSPPGP
jgi:prepilin-type N-terminal cleavage/methylation domain-containing protein